MNDKPIRLFADQCVPRSVSTELRSAGWDVLILKDYLATDAPDPQVIAKAQELGCLLLSLNGDFSDIVAYPPEQYLGIVSLQIKNHPEVTHSLVARWIAYLDVHPSADHYRGKLFLVEAHRIRVRT